MDRKKTNHLTQEHHVMRTKSLLRVLVFHCIWVIAFLWVIGCTGKSTKNKISEQPFQEQIPDQNEGWKIIKALSKAYGDNPSIIGDFIGSSRCPDFLEGHYFDGNTLVFQVRGDTMSARQTLEKVSGSKAFRIEQLTDSIFSEKQLHYLLGKLNSRYDLLQDNKLKSNVTSWECTTHHIEVILIRNTPEVRTAFRRLLMNSPAIRFSGPEEPVRNSTIGVSEAYGICLYPEYLVYADTSSTASFILLNRSNEPITCSEHYSITYEGTDGQWYELPINFVAMDIAYMVNPDSQHRFVARLYPEVNDNKPGRYRFFYGVSFESGENIRMMAEFRLTDDYKEVGRIGKTPIPKTTGRNYVEVPQIDDQMVYQVVEEMPEFPGGMPALKNFIRKNLRHDKAETRECVILQIVVDKEGNAVNPVILQSVNPILDEEALRIIGLMPKWKPGRQNGKNRNVRFALPVIFEPSRKELR